MQDELLQKTEDNLRKYVLLIVRPQGDTASAKKVKLLKNSEHQNETG